MLIIPFLTSPALASHPAPHLSLPCHYSSLILQKLLLSRYIITAAGKDAKTPLKIMKYRIKKILL